MGLFSSFGQGYIVLHRTEVKAKFVTKVLVNYWIFYRAACNADAV